MVSELKNCVMKECLGNTGQQQCVECTDNAGIEAVPYLIFCILDQQNSVAGVQFYFL